MVESNDGARSAPSKKKKAETKQLPASASLTIHEAAAMPQARRVQIANWLRDQAKFLTKNGANFSKVYRARFNP